MSTFFEAVHRGQGRRQGRPPRVHAQARPLRELRPHLEPGDFVVRKLIPSVLIHTKSVDKKFIEDHYDRGNDFFEAFLGDRMVYTSAFFKSQDETLEQAQDRKIHLVCQKLQLKPGEKLLDIGCGWGTLVMRAAKHFGVDATGVTIVDRGRRVRDRPHQEARPAGQGAHPDPRLPRHPQPEVRQDLQPGDGRARRHQELPEVPHARSTTCSRTTASSSCRSSACAAAAEELRLERVLVGLFMSKYIFPGADASPALSWVIKQLEKAGFEIHTVENVNVHYGMTIHRWYQNWLKNKAKVVAGYGERWYRLWEIFLAWSGAHRRRGPRRLLPDRRNKQLPAFNRYRYVGENVSLGERMTDAKPKAAAASGKSIAASA